MVKMTAVYTGHKHCQANHEPSGSVIETDAPKDNQGRGEKFSPTDLVATALGTCALTTIAIFAEKDSVDVTGSRMSVEKEMTPPPRRIASLKVILEMPASIPENYREKIRGYADNCPVKKSLHPDVNTPIEIHYVL
jgi:putative redox protein